MIRRASLLFVCALMACATGSAKRDAGARADAAEGRDLGGAIDEGPAPALDTGPIELDLGELPRDLGPPELGPPDVGAQDLGTPDAREAGVNDAGPVPVDLGPAPVDAGPGGCIPFPSVGTSIDIAGSLTAASPVWARPNNTGCPTLALSSIGSNTPYAVHVFCVATAAATMDFELRGQVTAGAFTLADPFLAVYAGTAIPGDARMCVDVDDDSAALGRDALATAPVASGTRLVVVATSSTNGGYGTYQLHVTAR